MHSVAPAAVVTWHFGNDDRSIGSQTETEFWADGWVSTRSSVRFPSSLYSGQNLSCSVEHLSLRAPEKRTILVEHSMFSLSQWVTHQLAQLPVPSRRLLFSFPGAHLMSVWVGRQQNSPLWMAACDYRGPSLSVNLAWLLPGQTKSQTSMELEQEGQFLKARLTYQFSLDLHEGQNLTCAYWLEQGSTEKTVHVPEYRELHGNNSKCCILCALQANVHAQLRYRWLFRRHLSRESSKPHDSSAKPLQR